MTLHTRSGCIEIITGPMFSGKSEELLRRVRRAVIGGQRVHLFTSHGGVPNEPGITANRGGAPLPESRAVDRPDEILRCVGPLEAVDLVALDDAHFLGAGLVEVATHLAEQGVCTVLAGIDTDFRGEPFGVMGHLMTIAESVTKLSAICTVCGAAASRTQRMVDGRRAHWEMPVFMAGGADRYQARCRRCFSLPRHDEHQVSLL